MTDPLEPPEPVEPPEPIDPDRSPEPGPRPDPVDVHEVEAVNQAFYTAFEQGDVDAMRALWVDEPEALCVHPGALPLRGTPAINRSWALVM
ncbi:MAG: nuclear transport factor 2 family protein, partial [Actinomycetes bacterium]